MSGSFSRRIFKVFTGTITAGILCAVSASAYTYSAYTTMTGTKTFALNPFLYLEDVSDRASSGADLVIAFGLRDDLDIYANLAGFYGLDAMPGENPYYGSWIMPRYDFGDNNIGALQFGITLDEDGETRFFVGPQYHFYRENDLFAFEANAMFYSKNNPVTANPWAGATVGPVWKAIPDLLFPYVEVNPEYDFGSDSTEGTFDLTIAPGVCIAFHDTKYQVSISVPISGLATREATAGIAAWCWFGFGGTEE